MYFESTLKSFSFCTGKKVRGKSLSLPLQSSTCDDGHLFVNQQQQPYGCRKQPLSRTKSTTIGCNKADALDLPKNTFGPATGHLSATSPQSPASSYYRMRYQMNNMPPSPSSLNQNGDLSNAFAAAAAADSGTNLHRKLQRQLSINPTCDPRIYQTQRRFASPVETRGPGPHHMPAARHYSYQESNYLSAPHSNVTRISSAPPANPAYTVSNECAHGSSSEPQLNLTIPSHRRPANHSPVSSSLWSVHAHAPAPGGGNYVVMPPNIEETRRKLHYHLASIFPEEQVDAAMRYYPNETNPQKICAAILTMFSSKP